MRATGSTEAEQRLLDLARELPPSAVEAVRALVEAYRPDSPLPRAVAQAWLAGQRDKTRALALAWAREQVRLALAEALARGASAPRPPDGDTLAWLVLAACEALAHEPASAASDRLPILLDFIGSGARGG